MIEYWKNLDLKDLFYINENGLVCQEEWKDVPNYEGLYQASDLSRFKSLDRYVPHPRGGKKKVNARILKQPFVKKGYYRIGLNKNGVLESFESHKLLAIIFFNHKPNGHKSFIVDHKNNNPKDNSLFNLQLITVRRNNNKDKVQKSGFVGIEKNKYGKFISKIYFEGKPLNLGIFDEIKDAVSTRVKVYDLISKGKDFSSYVKKRKVSEHKYIYYIPNKNWYTCSITVYKTSVFIGNYIYLEDAIKIRDIALKNIFLYNGNKNAFRNLIKEFMHYASDNF